MYCHGDLFRTCGWVQAGEESPLGQQPMLVQGEEEGTQAPSNTFFPLGDRQGLFALVHAAGSLRHAFLLQGI